MKDVYDFSGVIDRTGTDAVKWDLQPTNAEGESVLPMWVADMDFPAPPAVVEAIRRRASHSVFGYTIFSRRYQEVICGWQQKRNGWTIHPDEMVFSPSVMPAVITAIQEFSEPGDEVILQPPVYYPFFNAVRSNGRSVVENPLVMVDGRYCMDLDGLRHAITPRTRLLILCSPHNPVGRVWTAQELGDLAEICLRNNVMILVDEIHSDLTRSDTAFVATASLSAEVAAGSITCIAPTKTFNLAGIASSVVVAPDATIRARMETALRRVGHRLPNAISLAAGEAAFSEGEDWLDALRRYLDQQIAWFSRELTSRIPQISMATIEGTYLGWLDFTRVLEESGLESAQLNQAIRDKGRLWLSDGAVFGSGGVGFQRINLACPRALAEDGLDRIGQAVERIL